MIFFFVLVSIVILQRISELLISKRNEKIMLSKGGVEFGQRHYKFIVVVHSLFFVSLIFEKIMLKRELSDFWVYLFIIFLLAQFLRYWAIISLGVHWNTRVIVIPGDKLIVRGPYKFMHHPNYLAVTIELAVIPLIFSCYITALAILVLYLILLKERISVENEALATLHR